MAAAPGRDFFFEYETTIQFENLDHFSNVIPAFTPQYIITTTLNRVVRDMSKHVNRLVYIYASNYAEEELDSNLDELGCASNHYIFESHGGNHFTRRDIRKERARVAGIGFGQKYNAKASCMEGLEDPLDQELKGGSSTKTGVAATEKTSPLDDSLECGEANSPSFQETQKDLDDRPEDTTLDSTQSRDSSEEDFSDFEKDVKMAKDATQVDSDASQQDNLYDSPASTEDGEDTSDLSDDPDDKCLHDHVGLASMNASKHRRKEMKILWKDLEKSFDKTLGVSTMAQVIEPKPIDPHHLSTTKDWAPKTVKLKPLPENAYRYLTDVKVSRQCWTLTVKFGWPLEKCPRRLTLLNHFVNVIKKCTLHETPGLSNPRILAGSQTETKSAFEIQCEGSNFRSIFDLTSDYIDHSRVTTNDIRTIFQFFGIEACRTSIIRELNKVFSVYGITVDYRHMSLIADTMTYSGAFRPFSRLGIQYHSSPLLQMSFETSMKFLTEAIQRRAIDNLKTPAGAIVTGKTVMVGTGLCNVLTKIKLPKQHKKNKRTSLPKRSSILEDHSFDTLDRQTACVKPNGKKRAINTSDTARRKKCRFKFT